METVAISSALVVALPILFLVLVAVFVYFSFTMIHHWGYYSFNSGFKRAAQWTYLGVSILILAALAFFIGIYIFGNGIQA